MRAFFPCPDCGKASKLAESIKRTNDQEQWKYRRYHCAGGHTFSTAERVYKPVQRRKPVFAKLTEEIQHETTSEHSERI